VHRTAVSAILASVSLSCALPAAAQMTPPTEALDTLYPGRP
jgi:hypothetical protein